MGWQEVAGDRNFARAYGRYKLKSTGSFKAARKGDSLYIEGNITHSCNEPYNFENGQPGAVEARALEGAGMAAPFATKAKWAQSVKAVVPIISGRLGKPIVTWGEVREEPKE